MAVKKTIAIVGATEKNGTEMANQFAFTDYRLLLISNDINQLTHLSNNISEKKPKAEIDSIECVKDGCWEADIIILAVPFHEQEKVAEMMKEVATQKIVVTISNEKSEKIDLQHLLPHSRLVKVLNILKAKAKEIFIAGNDEEANKEILTIFKKAGYYPVITDHFSAIESSNH